jgi:hypothetical protein
MSWNYRVARLLDAAVLTVSIIVILALYGCGDDNPAHSHDTTSPLTGEYDGPRSIAVPKLGGGAIHKAATEYWYFEGSRFLTTLSLDDLTGTAIGQRLIFRSEGEILSSTRDGPYFILSLDRDAGEQYDYTTKEMRKLTNTPAVMRVLIGRIGFMRDSEVFLTHRGSDDL